ncbi:hypothetical protein DK847_16700 [Aestuariivirga litoralis]|uniref:Uncharacterized protein n=1 Tax=Aestuariivirga litoralis TaxID=2650924 RepID=A0A2W2BI58_9HYPH|nr:hypothetical protein DK847_16700 [Aestuariivirga litoralis]
MPQILVCFDHGEIEFSCKIVTELQKRFRHIWYSCGQTCDQPISQEFLIGSPLNIWQVLAGNEV